MALDPKRILVVDDDELSRDLVKFILHKIPDCEVEEEADIDSAYEAILTKKFDAVVSDIKMPGGTGFDLVQKIKNAGLKVPVILMSAHTDKDFAVRALREGCADIIEKPVPDEELLSAIKRIAREKTEIKGETLQRMSLTRFQRRILALVLEGFTNKEIGSILNLTEQGIKYHVRIMLQKFQAKNRRELMDILS